MQKSIVITGAYSGIGLELSNKFASEGYKLVLSGRDEKKLDKLVARLKLKTETVGVKADIQKELDCKKLIRRAMQAYGKIDILVNNAGVWEHEDRAEFVGKIIDTNVKGVEWCTIYAIEGMIESGDGTVVNIGSTSGIRFKDAEAIYASSKFAVMGYSGYLYKMYREKVKVICFCPGGTKTDLFRGTPNRVSKEFMNTKKVAQILFETIKKGESGIFALEKNGEYMKADFDFAWNWKPLGKKEVA